MRPPGIRTTALVIPANPPLVTYANVPANLLVSTEVYLDVVTHDTAAGFIDTLPSTTADVVVNDTAITGASFGAPVVTTTALAAPDGTVTTLAAVSVPFIAITAEAVVSAVATVTGFGDTEVLVFMPSVLNLDASLAGAVTVAASHVHQLALGAALAAAIDLPAGSFVLAPADAGVP